MAKTYTVFVAESDDGDGPVTDVSAILDLDVESMVEARYVTHTAFEAVGVLHCAHPPLEMPETMKERFARRQAQKSYSRRSSLLN